jgi:hypothetical protein
MPYNSSRNAGIGRLRRMAELNQTAKIQQALISGAFLSI